MLEKRVLQNTPFSLHWKSLKVISFDDDSEKRMKNMKSYFSQTLPV